MSDNAKLYVGNLPFSSTAQDLEALFGQVGTVSVVEIIFDKFTGRSRGFAFVTMTSPDEANQAVEKFHGYEIEGRALAVNIARPREDRPPRSFGDGGGGGGGFRGGGRRGGGGGYRGGGGRGDRGDRGSGGYGRE
ncbi:MAG TPA: RNA-binding protein [Candidatus Didemnitutus sp.]|jgi:RNA recognition motif-containing protein